MAENVATQTLARAAMHMQQRAEQYDIPGGERSMAATVQAFNAIAGRNLTEVEGWQFMAILKMVRSQTAVGDAKRDSYEDGVAYLALAAEAALK